MFDLGRDEDCAHIARALGHLSRLAKIPFREISWRESQEADEEDHDPPR